MSLSEKLAEIETLSAATDFSPKGEVARLIAALRLAIEQRDEVESNFEGTGHELLDLKKFDRDLLKILEGK